MTRRRLMAVHAHPSDESGNGAATLAKYVAQGAEVLVVTCTGGERGAVLNPAHPLSGAPADLGATRAREMERARRVLGVRLRWLGYPDSGPAESGEPLPADCFARADLAAATGRLVRLIRSFRPHVVTAPGEDGGHHPDHLMAHRVTAAAFGAAGDRLAHPGSGRPWQPLKLYYGHTSHPARSTALRLALRRRGHTVPYTPLPGEPAHQPHLTTRVPCAEYFPRRDRALLAHASQVDPHGSWFTVPTTVQQEVWPTEDYTLARSLVPADLPEDDLFAGITTGDTALAASAAHPSPAALAAP
ncbi:mycothiol conjugate amidase Mca [Streptomyces sp. NPDC058794]|uniref:mycothiol conjugate amidase Mca n=1 Tax=unclassified Streptomyces TaxID=2593676 RepID=UPI0036CBA157